MDKKWFGIYERLVNTDTGFDIDLSQKLLRTDFVAEELAKLGFKLIRESAAHVGILGKPPYITLIGHLDTVFKEGESSKRPFNVRNDIVYGPGVADMKGGIVTLLATVEKAVSSGFKDICVIMNVDEELGSKTSRETFYKYAKESICCLSFEPGGSNGEVVISRKGIASMNLTVRGIKGHASRLEEGANAIVEASKKLVEIYSLNEKFSDLTANPTIVNGGEKSNITPDLCMVYFDVRFSDQKDLEKFKEKVFQICSFSSIKGTNCDLSLQERRPAMKPHPEILKALEEISKELLKEIKVQHSNGGADSAFFYQFDVPSIDGLGISGGRFHSEDEYAILSSFEPKIELSMALIKHFSNRR